MTLRVGGLARGHSRGPATVVTVWTSELHDAITKLRICYRAVIEGTTDESALTIALHEILQMKRQPRLVRLRLSPPEMDLTFSTVHLHLQELRCVVGLKMKNIPTGWTS